MNMAADELLSAVRKTARPYCSRSGGFVRPGPEEQQDSMRLPKSSMGRRLFDGKEIDPEWPGERLDCDYASLSGVLPLSLGV